MFNSFPENIRFNEMFYLFLFFFSRLVVSDCLQPHGLYSTRLPCPWDFPGKNTGVGCHFLLQGIFLTQGLNLGLLHYRQMLYRLSHQGSPIGYSLIQALLTARTETYQTSLEIKGDY